jgi:mono/diheme cytochrome c family protein
LAYARPAAERPDARGLLEARGCLSCHRLDRSGGFLGPDLSGVGARLPPEVIEAVLTAPGSVKPGAVMPRPDLLPEEREELVRFLAERQ